jgi:DNA polymerase-3 subunit gamma/tau
LSLTPEIDERLGEQAQRIASAEVVRLLDLLGAALEAVRAGADARTQLELALVKAATPQTDGSPRALLARIERLEQSLAAKPASMPPPSAVSPPSTVSSPSIVSSPSAVSPSLPPTSPARVEPQEPIVEPAPQAESVSATEVGPAPDGALEQRDAASVAVAAATLSVSDLDALWPAVHESVRTEHELLGAVFNEAIPVYLTDEELTLAFPPTATFHKRKAEDPANRATLIDILRRLTGRRYLVSFELREDLPSQEGSNGRPPTEEEIMARLVAELDAEELPEDWLQQQKGGE